MAFSFSEHPASVGETYFGHLFSALSFCAKITVALLACLVHAFLPFMFEKTGSRMIRRLMGDMVDNRDKRPHAASEDIAEEIKAA